MSRAQSIEGRQPQTIEGDLEPFGGLPPVGMGHQEVGVCRTGLQIFQVADQDFLCRHAFQYR